MSSFPNAEDYARSRKYMPWGVTVDFIMQYLQGKLPANAIILDMMCGPGHISRELKDIFPQAEIFGVDIDLPAIEYARRKYSDIVFYCGDARVWEPDTVFDLILVNAGLHHLPHEDQPVFLRRLKPMVKRGGTIIVADPYIGEYRVGAKHSRELAAARLGVRVINETEANNPPKDINEIAYDIMVSDILEDKEFKTSISRSRAMFQEVFGDFRLEKTWPKDETNYGEYVFIIS